MAETYLFYDIETTGLNRAFDQILEFAAIRTDGDLNELDRFTAAIRLRPDVIPSPSAILVNRLRPQTGRGRCEVESLREIHAQLNRPETTSIGYNSIGFDDEFLRFSFHRNLLPPYTHQFANGCRRMDLLPVTIMYWLYQREPLQWPELNGKASLKLEDIGAANGLFTGQAHDALSDVEATLRLARLLSRETKTWRHLDDGFRKDIDGERSEELPVAFKTAAGDHKWGVLVSSEFGTRQHFLAPVIAIGYSIPYPKQSLWLRLDLPHLMLVTEPSVAETTWVTRKRFGEPGFLLPPTDRTLEPIDRERRQHMQENLRWLESHAEKFQQISTYHRNFRYAFIPNLDADASLYQTGFLPRADEALCRAFHAAAFDKKVEIAARFSSPEARILAERLLFRNYDDPLPPHLSRARDAFQRRICRKEALTDFTGNRRTTPRSALAEIHKLRQSAGIDDDQRRLLDDLQDHILRRFPCDAPGEQLSLL
jgi:exodeoxyribonuclease-1